MLVNNLFKLCACSFFVCCGFFVTAQNANLILFKDVTIIDGRASIKPYKGSVLIENGLIKQIFTNQTTYVNKDMHVIDCHDKFIMPGVIDAHVHLGTQNLEDEEKAVVYIDSALQHMVAHGITTVRDMSGYVPFIKDRIDEIANKKIIGPSVYYSAQFAGPEYFKLLHLGDNKWKQGQSAWSQTLVDSSNVQQAVKRAKDIGVTGIKIYAELSKELVKEITKEAHAQGLMAWSHVNVSPAKPMDAAQAGVNSMSHAHDFPFEALKDDQIGNTHLAWGLYFNKQLTMTDAHRDSLLLTMKKNNVFLDPTLLLAETNRFFIATDMTERAHQLGVRIIAGTDWVNPTSGDELPLLQEMTIYVEKCGLTTLQAIETATFNAAEAMGLDDRGVIETGKRADLLLLEHDPLQSLRVIFLPEIVIKNGELISHK